MTEQMDPGLRAPTEIEKPYGMRKGAKQRVITAIVLLGVTILFILFVRARRTQQDPVKAMKAKAAEQAARGGEPARPAGIQGTKIAPQKEQDAVAEFTKASQEAAAKADAEKSTKGRVAGGGTPPGMAPDGTAGPSDAPGRPGEAGTEPGAAPSAGGSVGGYNTNPAAFDHARYYRDENGQLVEPSYLKGRTSPVTREGHLAIDLAYMAGLASGTTIGENPEEARALDLLAQRYRGLQRGLWTYPVPRKAPKSETLSPEQMAQLQQLMKQQGGAR